MASLVSTLIVDEIAQEVSDAQYVFFGKFSGLKVADFEQLRRSLKPNGRRCIVVKHTLARRAFKNIGYEEAADLLTGMSCLVSGTEEPQQVSKALAKFQKEREGNFSVCGGLMNGRIVTGEFIHQMAKLPSKLEMRAQVVGLMKSPINGFVLNLRGILQSLVNVLSEVKKKTAPEGAA